ncbi:MAG TPA: hypothetical protein VFI13_13825, partial [Gemmatimonadales bacterium]|nr:hypothetical protein [Gemmatimonadales bacterium]
TERRSAAAAAAYWERMFCHPGALGDHLGSYVYESREGEVVGFQGVVERTMRFLGGPIRVAVGTQLMVAPEHRGFAGRALVRALLGGPQDLTLSDVANDSARRLWESLGAHCAVTESLSWTWTLRPLRHRANEVVMRGAGLATRGALLAVRPFLTAGDALGARRPTLHADVDVVPIDPDVIAETAQALFAPFALAPDYTPDSIGWLLTQLREKRQFGELVGGIVRLRSGGPVGWFLYYRNRGGECEVVQVAADPRHALLVLDQLAVHARRRGGVALTGRITAAMLPDLAARNVTLRHEGPWVLYHSSRPEISDALGRGDAWLSRLDAEWWMSF